ncbi:phosphatidylinositide phosphatase SAC2 isoform X1 [Spodoptera frugiperda]|uniref:Phosphatidylinositide phosphatase SAC2 isoform X1 n=2 Tax=Spodoptera frugiperda TaxID=7108 RepID=A0A9R0DV96_SPOFR|nr:phosphatidylinositide phosphatase SAC2 isoform X1 [Spodoptera frugiperda]XP_050554097.1 phosphatidylinositide phosphatase SAC2 isoform X1 [Spodoptera frugiperda]
MELFRSESFYIFVRNESSLWWNRTTGAFSVRSAWDMSDIEDIECLGITDGILGKVEHTNIFEPRLMIIKESAPVGTIYFHHSIYKIKSVCFLNMGPVNQEIELTPCTKHGSMSTVASSNKSLNKKMGARLFENSAFLNKTVGAVKNVSNTIKTTTQQAATQPCPGPSCCGAKEVPKTQACNKRVKQSVKKQRDPKLAERFEKRLTDELLKIFDDSESFYYSRTLDLTNSLQRQYEIEKILESEAGTGKPVVDITKWWKHVDDRFFWNKHMMKDIIALGSPDCDQWILPIIQGYVHLSQIAVEPADINPLNTESLSNPNTCDETFTLGLISRRSRYQAGTRYNRRGIEPGGKVANYVETEQIVSIICSDSIHRASFVQVRGSVPIFWSQPEYKFRPPPRLDRTEDESHEAFKKHFAEELTTYKNVCIVNLVEQQGRERIIWEAYGNHVLRYNSPDVIYATFDFHEYCRGMHYENVSILINALADVIGEMRFCWRDDRGLICTQNGVFRVNCIDCLDRTNVVQTAIAKYVLELQLCRLGLGTPGCGLPPSLRQAFLTMWADNGDVISRQYAGTKALKGDYTRTGERKFTGLMKDGVASANRYYLSTFKDALRQVAIDVMTGESRSIPDQLIVPECGKCTSVKVLMFNDHTEPDTAAMAQHVKSLIDDCKKLLVDTEPVLGSWGLIDADPNTGDPQETEMDSVLVLTSSAYYVADYDETSDRLLGVQRVALADVTLIELGPFDANCTTLFSVGRKNNPEPVYCVRIHYSCGDEPGYFHMFRSTTLRFFNNMAVVINTRDEMIESLHSICESLMVARDVAKLPPIPFHDGVKLEKRKSKAHPGQSGNARSSIYLDLSRLPTLTRNVSETQLVADIRSVGSKALTNMTEQFSKLNKLSHSLNARARPSLQLKFDQSASRTKKIFTLGQNKDNKKKGSLSDGMSSDYSSDDENRTNIFEPTLDNFENTQHYIGKPAQKTEAENDCELIQNPLYSSKIEPHETQDFIPSEIVTNVEKQASKTPSNVNKINPFNIDASKTPEIQVDGAFAKPAPPSSLMLAQKLSHSSNELNFDDGQSEGVNFHVRSNSQHEITLNIAQSHSESAIKQFKNIASPVGSATKDMVLSPLTKLAKGVQNLGANLDPRKIKAAPAVKQVTEQQYEEHRKLQEKWRDCNTRLVAL